MSDRDSILAELAAIPQLAKPFYLERTTADAFRLDHTLHDVLEAIARVGGRITVPLGSSRDAYAEASAMAKRADAKIALRVSPFAGDNGQGDPRDTPTMDARLRVFTAGMNLARSTIGDTSLIEAVLIDNERFVWNDDAVWNAALDALHNRFYIASKTALPFAYVDQWERGSYQAQPTNEANRWEQKRWYTGRERGDGYSTTHFCLPDQGSTRDELWTALSAEINVVLVMAWVALGTGTRPTFGGDATYDRAWNYDPAYAWHAGAWLANHPRVTRLGSIVQPQEDWEHPFWRHLIAFLLGASGIKREPAF